METFIHYRSADKSIRKDTLDIFISFSSLRLYKYSATQLEITMKRKGTCSMTERLPAIEIVKHAMENVIYFLIIVRVLLINVVLVLIFL